MAKLRNSRVVPPGGWSYIQVDTGNRFEENSIEELVAKIRIHRKFKGLPEGDIQREVEEQLCMRLSNHECLAYPGEEYEPYTDLTENLTAGKLISLNNAVMGFLKGGAAIVPKEESERRAAICRVCPLNKPTKQCSCSLFYKALAALIPASRTEADLDVCMACGCSLKAKVLLPDDAIKSSLPPGIRFPDACWQNSIANMDTTENK